MKRKRSTFRRRHNPTVRHPSDYRYAFRAPDGAIVNFADAIGEHFRVRPRNGIVPGLLRLCSLNGFTDVRIALPLNRGSGDGLQRALKRERGAAVITVGA